MILGVINRAIKKFSTKMRSYSYDSKDMIEKSAHSLLSIEKWLDALLPSRCAACDTVSNLQLICSLCESTISLANSGQSIEINSVFSYSGAIKKMIIEAKFCRNEKKAHALISYWSKQSSQENLLERLENKIFNAVCFVPIHWRRRLWRGFDLSALFANAVSHKLNLPLVDLLISNRLDKPLTLAHSKTEREHMTKDRYVMRKSLASPLSILLVDDVTTTGATLRAASQVLQKNEHKVCALTLAKTPARP